METVWEIVKFAFWCWVGWWMVIGFLLLLDVLWRRLKQLAGWPQRRKEKARIKLMEERDALKAELAEMLEQAKTIRKE